MRDISVGDIMTRNLVHVEPDANLLNCAQKMIKKRVGSLVLLEKGEIKGILTEKDIIWALTKKQDISNIKAKDVASKKVVTIKPNASIDETLEKMTKRKVRRLPVVSNKKIIGYITLKDVLRFKPSLFESIEEFENIREEAAKIKRSASARKGEFLESLCEECGNFDVLTNVDGKMICESCRDSM